MSEPRRRNLVHDIVEFCRLLRTHGLRVTPSETVVALDALAAVDLMDREEFRIALRATLTGGFDELEIFDQLFEKFWGSSPVRAERTVKNSEHRTQGQEEFQERLAVAEGKILDHLGLEEASKGGGEQETLYSPLESLSEKDFSDFRPDQMSELTWTIIQMARKLATRQSRRMQRSKRGSMIDPRQMLRRNLKYEGTMIELEHKQRKVRKPRLVLLCDVSRSMDQYSEFLLQFIYAFQHVFGRVEAFVFSTQLTRVTDFFRTHDIFAAVERVSQEVPDWSGGTRIGESIQAFNEHFAPSLLGNRTITIILSDGLDTGNTDLLRQAMQVLQQKSRRVIWLNPLLGDPEYQPLARGMRAALPYIDAFESAHNLDSLQELGQLIEL